jgi:peptidoglycan hydrolase CwlO-like protein
MRKEIVLTVLLSLALLSTASLTSAEADLKMRVTLFARAAIAESLRTANSYGPNCALGGRIQDLDRHLATLEKEVKMFSGENHARKQQMVAEFKRNLIEKCCRRTGRGR